MFTGLIQTLARVSSITPSHAGASLLIDPAGWDHHPALGDSIAVNGCCLTVANQPDSHAPALRFDVVRQTLDMTNLGDLRAGDPVNLEHSTRPDTLMGGHIVQGHIDAVAQITRITADPLDWRVTFKPPAHLMDLFVPQGSVAIDGISLTIAGVTPDTFDVALIPTTLQKTNLGARNVGDRVNVETDIVARTIVHWLNRRSKS